MIFPVKKFRSFLHQVWSNYILNDTCRLFTCCSHNILFICTFDLQKNGTKSATSDCVCVCVCTCVCVCVCVCVLFLFSIAKGKKCAIKIPNLCHHHHLSLNGDDVETPQIIPQSVSSTALWDLANSRPVHSLMLSSHLFLCLPCLIPPFTVLCKMVLARPDERET